MDGMSHEYWNNCCLVILFIAHLIFPFCPREKTNFGSKSERFLLLSDWLFVQTAWKSNLEIFSLNFWQIWSDVTVVVPWTIASMMCILSIIIFIIHICVCLCDLSLIHQLLFSNNSWSWDLDFQWYVTFPDTGVTATPRLWVQSRRPPCQWKNLPQSAGGCARLHPAMEGCYHMSNEEKGHWLFRVYRWSYYKGIWGL